MVLNFWDNCLLLFYDCRIEDTRGSFASIELNEQYCIPNKLIYHLMRKILVIDQTSSIDY